MAGKASRPLAHLPWRQDLNDKICVELLMGAVFGIAALVGSPTGGDHSSPTEHFLRACEAWLH